MYGIARSRYILVNLFSNVPSGRVMCKRHFKAVEKASSTCSHNVIDMLS